MSSDGYKQRRILLAQLLALLAGLAVVLPVELTRLVSQISGVDGLAGVLTAWNVDTTPYFFLFLLLPLFWRRGASVRTEEDAASSGSRDRQNRRSGRSKARSATTSCKQVGSEAGEPPGLWAVAVLALQDSPCQPRLPARSARRTAWGLAATVGLVALFASWHVARTPVGPQGQFLFGSLPPALHDEYSYLFQAKTFLAGRLSFPSHPVAPRLFDQMHVLNEGRFASRYFPGVGAWLAPFVALNHPHWGHWLANAVTASLTFAIGRELASNGVGLLAGLLLALAPGYALFSNLLLSHHPTLVGLSLFTYGFLRSERTGSCLWALASGFALSFAMLCRPLTAFGYCLPFAASTAASLIRTLFQNRAAGQETKRQSGRDEAEATEKEGGPPQPGTSCSAHHDRVQKDSLYTPAWRRAACLVIPVLAGLAFLGFYNRAITGRVLLTPYQLYTNIYTPRHVYGFNNVVRGQRAAGPRVLQNYDRWAENLTLPLAVRNVRNRLLASWQWTVGVVPLLMTTLFVSVAVRSVAKGWWLLAAAVLCVHGVYFPYWYDGILHWHYVFETGMLWTLLLGIATERATVAWHRQGRTRMPVWWTLILASAVTVNWISLPPLWATSRLQAGIEEFAFPRLKYEAFRQMVQQEVTERPALVLVEPDPADRHIDFVVNDPDLSGPVLFGRFRPVADQPLGVQLSKILKAFPDRTVYLFRAKEWSIHKVGRWSSDGRLHVPSGPNTWNWSEKKQPTFGSKYLR